MKTHFHLKSGKGVKKKSYAYLKNACLRWYINILYYYKFYMNTKKYINLFAKNKILEYWCIFVRTMASKKLESCLHCTPFSYKQFLSNRIILFSIQCWNNFIVLYNYELTSLNSITLVHLLLKIYKMRTTQMGKDDILAIFTFSLQ